MPKYTKEQIIEYCKKRMSKAKKYHHVNFWAFIALDLIELKYKEECNNAKT